jgi:hypothetical protein
LRRPVFSAVLIGTPHLSLSPGLVVARLISTRGGACVALARCTQSPRYKHPIMTQAPLDGTIRQWVCYLRKRIRVV